MLPLVVVLQIALIAAELFALGAFTRFEPTQAWVLWLIWHGGLVSVMSTAASAHILCTFAVNGASTCNVKDLTFLTGATQKCRVGTDIRVLLTTGFIGVCAAFMGVVLLAFSLLTISSVSTHTYRAELEKTVNKVEIAISSATRATDACKSSMMHAGHRPRVTLLAIINDKRQRTSERSHARDELASVLGQEDLQLKCHEAERVSREAHRSVMADLPAVVGQIVRLAPWMPLETALYAYPMAQGIVVWLFAFLGAALLHVMAATARGAAVAMDGGVAAPVAAAASKEVESVAAPEPTPKHLSVADTTPLGAVPSWLMQLSVGPGDMTLVELHADYLAWCALVGVKPAEASTVKRLIAGLMIELGIPKTRRRRVWAYRGVSAPRYANR